MKQHKSFISLSPGAIISFKQNFASWLILRIDKLLKSSKTPCYARIKVHIKVVVIRGVTIHSYGLIHQSYALRYDISMQSMINTCSVNGTFILTLSTFSHNLFIQTHLSGLDNKDCRGSASVKDAQDSWQNC